VQVRQARAVAARWVLANAAGRDDFAGAFVSGSTAWSAVDAELPATSDVDVVIVTSGKRPPGKSGKFRWDGVLIEVSYLTWADLPSGDAVAGTYYLAGSFRADSGGIDTILADPTGRLGALRAEVAARFARRPWVRRRCANAEQRITDGLRALDVTAAWHQQVLGWVFPTGVTTHVLLTAGLRNPTVRLRYPAVRALLTGHDRLDHYEELLALLGCADMTRERAEHHLRTMTDAFDTTVGLSRTPFPFSSDITADARPVAVDGSRALIEQGSHREAVFWLVVTYARCLTILAHDAPGTTTARFEAGFRDLVGDLGITSSADIVLRAQQTRDFLPRLRHTAEAIMTDRADVVDRALSPSAGRPASAGPAGSPPHPDRG
jgi:hypothetical protein